MCTSPLLSCTGYWVCHLRGIILRSIVPKSSWLDCLGIFEPAFWRKHLRCWFMLSTSKVIMNTFIPWSLHKWQCIGGKSSSFWLIWVIQTVLIIAPLSAFSLVEDSIFIAFNIVQYKYACSWSVATYVLQLGQVSGWAVRTYLHPLSLVCCIFQHKLLAH